MSEIDQKRLSHDFVHRGFTNQKVSSLLKRYSNPNLNSPFPTTKLDKLKNPIFTEVGQMADFTVSNCAKPTL